MSKITQEQLFRYLAMHPSGDVDLEDLEAFCELDNIVGDYDPSKDEDVNSNTKKDEYTNYNSKEDKDVNSNSKEDVDSGSENWLKLDDVLGEYDPSKDEDVNSNSEEDNLSGSGNFLKKSDIFSSVERKCENQFNSSLMRNPMQDSFITLLKNNNKALSIVRASEVRNLLSGRTKKKALNGKVNFYTAIDLLCGKISTSSLAKTILKEEADIYNSIPCKIKVAKTKLENLDKKINSNISSFSQDELEEISRDYIYLVDKIKSRIDYLEFESTFSFDEWEFKRLNISENLLSKTTIETPYEYICDYLERFKMFVDEVWSLSGIDEEVDAEIKLLYVILVGKPLRSNNYYYKLKTVFRIFSRRRLSLIDLDSINIGYLNILEHYFHGVTPSKLSKRKVKDIIEHVNHLTYLHSGILEKIKIPSFQFVYSESNSEDSKGSYQLKYDINKGIENSQNSLYNILIKAVESLERISRVYKYLIQ